MKLISLDSETTGLDLYHGAAPFFVTICTPEGPPDFWEWPVDPETRKPQIPAEDLEEIRQVIWDADEICLHNSKFDVAALRAVGIKEWPWDKTHDTLTAAHLLASISKSGPTVGGKDLTALAVNWLDWDILPYELAIREATISARNRASRYFSEWRVANKEQGDMPSARGKTWKYDMWLPKALATTLDYPDDHPWHTVLQDYANQDSETTVTLWRLFRDLIQQENLWEIYEVKRQVNPLVDRMERQGVPLKKNRLRALKNEYRVESGRLGRILVNLAAEVGYELKLPKTGNNASLRNFCFGTKTETELEGRVFEIVDGKVPSLKLPPLKTSKKTGEPSLDKEALEAYLKELPPTSKRRAFVKALKNKRQRDTAITYMNAYERFWQPWNDRKLFEEDTWVPAWPGAVEEDESGWYVLHPQLNPTGTNTLRFSCKNPNEQNISKKEGFNLRYAFGPPPGFEWYAFDADNIELRIPAYECGEEEFINLFERPKDPPYFGSNHLLISNVLHKEKFERCFSCGNCGLEILDPTRRQDRKYCGCVRKDPVVDGRVFKSHYPTEYGRTKNGNFAVQYGAIDRPDGAGTADRTYGISGAQSMIAGCFKKQDALGKYWIRYANQHGYVETIPDRSIGAKRGYPILCTRTERGRIKPTVPLSYHVQSTAMWWTIKAMLRVDDQLTEWRGEGFFGYIPMQIHDELDVLLQKGKVPPTEDLELEKRGKDLRRCGKSNLWRIRRIQELMRKGGDDIGIPTPVSCEYHPVSWDQGIKL